MNLERTTNVAFSESRRLSKGNFGSQVVFVIMPGVLMDARKAFSPLLSAIRRAAERQGFGASVVYAEYSRDYIDWSPVVQDVSSGLHRLSSDNMWDVVLPIAASFSGNVLNNAYIGSSAGKLSQRPIMIDPPFGATFAAPGASLVGRVWGAVKMPRFLNKNQSFFTGDANLPKEINIGNAGDFSELTDGKATVYSEYVKWVMEQAKSNLYGHRFTTFASQTGAMTKFRFASFDPGVRPLYIVNTDRITPPNWKDFEEAINPLRINSEGGLPVARPKNDTTRQPEAVHKWLDATDGRMDVVVVRSTHCGFMERPVAWREAIEYVVGRALDFSN